MATITNNLLACGDCDALQREPALAPGAAATCRRCGAELCREKPESLDRTLAFAIAAAIAFLAATSLPLMELNAQGIESTSTVYGLVQSLFETGWPSVAILVMMTVIVVPALEIGLALYLLVPLRFGYRPRALRPAARLLDRLWDWGMVEVFLLGAIVSLVKLTSLAEVRLGLALYAIGAYVVLVSGAFAAFDARAFWKRVDEIPA